MLVPLAVSVWRFNAKTDKQINQPYTIYQEHIHIKVVREYLHCDHTNFRTTATA